MNVRPFNNISVSSETDNKRSTTLKLYVYESTLKTLVTTTLRLLNCDGPEGGWHTIKHVLEVLMSLYRNCVTSSFTGPFILKFVEEIMLNCSDDVRFGDTCNVRYTVEHSDSVSWEGTITVTVPNRGD